MIASRPGGTNGGANRFENDDNPEVCTRRLEVSELRRPTQGILTSIDGLQPVDVVANEVAAAVCTENLV